MRPAASVCGFNRSFISLAVQTLLTALSSHALFNALDAIPLSELATRSDDGRIAGERLIFVVLRAGLYVYRAPDLGA